MSVLNPRENPHNCLESDGYGSSKFIYKDLYAFLRASESWQSPLSTIALLDMNAFFAQVEQLRLGLSIDDPVVCVQWNMLIAVSYAARKYGIGRMDTIKTAKEKCPHVILAHAAVFVKGDPMWSYLDELPNQGLCKVSLDPYRRESRKIMKVLKQSCDRIEKASVDECFMDLGEQIYNELFQLFPTLKKNQDPNTSLPPVPRKLPSSLHWNGFVYKNEKEELKGNQKNEFDDTFEPFATDWDDVCFIIGSNLLYRLRQDVYNNLGYTTSGGIANNRVVAKLAGGFRKPDNQTIVRNCALEDFLKKFELTDMQGMGGKIGEQIITKLKIPKGENSNAYIRDNFTVQTLEEKLKEDKQLIQKLYNLVRGVNRLELSFRIEIKSMMSRKNFQVKYPVQTLGDAFDWIKVFVGDIISRIVELDDENMELSPTTALPTKRRNVVRRPKTISVHINLNRKETSRQSSVPLYTDYEKLSKSLESITYRLLKEFFDQTTSLHLKNGGKHLKDLDDGKKDIKTISILPINALSLVATNFTKVSETSVFKPEPGHSNLENIRKLFAELDQEKRNEIKSTEAPLTVTQESSGSTLKRAQTSLIRDLFTKFNKDQQQTSTKSSFKKAPKSKLPVSDSIPKNEPNKSESIKDLFIKFNESQKRTTDSLNTKKRKSPSPIPTAAKREQRVLVLDQLLNARNRLKVPVTTNQPEGKAGTENYCSKCEKEIDDPMEHSDYHYALELSKAYNG
ncbi:DNA-directed DNA polymerase eta rad30 [Scheffersomyces spartinae]|uniref:DNA-directed DNA polymerase eta rad30 n=1 Tax=Scheffersomyces spartinae TaxID=45513 RepID=A0A9P7V4V1_9ASCO|nr:DNA-directed DNA polymerase eta rad30 [Scheffersomyces spartinae]KAG7191358.1 DNA-directed DNA polymerase eta rad30 [Scheffersomyces spartinae]